MYKSLSPAGRVIWKVAVVIQTVMGFTMGLYLFTQGPLLYERFSHLVDARLAMTLTTLLFGLGMGLEVLLEVPTGAIGDAIGRKRTVIISLIFRALFFVSLALVGLISSPISLLLIFSALSFIFFAFSYSFLSGTFTAWGVDSLRKSDPGIGYEHLLSTTYIFNFIAVIFGGVLGVVCYLNGLAHTGFFVATGLCLVLIIFCLREMQDDGVSGDIRILSGLRLGLIMRRMSEIMDVGFKVFRRSAVILSLVAMFSTFLFVRNIIDYLWPVYLRSRISEDVQGYYWVMLVVLVYFFCAFGSKMFSYFIIRNGTRSGVKKVSNEVLKNWMITVCLLSAIPVILLSWLTAQGLETFLYFVLAILPVFFAFGIALPCFETLVNNYIPDEHAGERATILSFASLLRSLLVLVLIVPSGGTSGDTTTIGWAIPAGLLLLATLVGAFVLKRKPKELTSPITIQPSIVVKA